MPGRPVDTAPTPGGEPGVDLLSEPGPDGLGEPGAGGLCQRAGHPHRCRPASSGASSSAHWRPGATTSGTGSSCPRSSASSPASGSCRSRPQPFAAARHRRCASPGRRSVTASTPSRRDQEPRGHRRVHLRPDRALTDPVRPAPHLVQPVLVPVRRVDQPDAGVTFTGDQRHVVRPAARPMHPFVDERRRSRPAAT